MIMYKNVVISFIMMYVFCRFLKRFLLGDLFQSLISEIISSRILDLFDVLERSFYGISSNLY